MAETQKILPMETLRQSYPKLNAAIDNSNEALSKAAIAESNAGSAVNTANTAVTKADSVQAQFNQVVIEGDSSVEAAQARVKAGGAAFTTLQERLNDSDNQLIGVNNKSFYRGLKNTRNAKPILTFIDDDANVAVWTQLKPVVEQEKVPISLATVTGRVDTNSTTLTLSQLKDLQKSGLRDGFAYPQSCESTGTNTASAA
ncbi:hypothetical protein [Cytobacillus oceanisediminis]|uniref:Uncharacterized protein n=1 Tax=Cytobacillus oceanisediminis TaxID=665099 RepID=A0ABX3CKN5_9BACI|nr:hypothetical protein [Cytobacillus oceanisediminis]OHX42359.1 hypothetical protein BBV17_27565 [Cytobacillus oceanisediminis]